MVAGLCGVWVGEGREGKRREVEMCFVCLGERFLGFTEVRMEIKIEVENAL